MSGKLVLVGTPLGNRADLSPRAREAIESADILLCEDTRSPQRLLGADAKLPPRRSCFVANEKERVPGMLQELAEGKTLVYVSEAGLPVWSDPGRLLVAAAVDAGFEVDVVPGPTAATVALCLSGFEPRGARFLGFIPRDGRARREALAELVGESGASLLYEAGNRTPALLEDLLAAGAGGRRCVVARELTKLHQEVLRGTVSELADRTTESLRGEVTVVLEGQPTSEDGDPRQEGARAALEVMLDPGLKPREKAKRLAELTGEDSKALYARLSHNG